jgi:hypothetical protein
LKYDRAGFCGFFNGAKFLKIFRRIQKGRFMRSKLFLSLLLLFCYTTQSQLAITPGAQLTISGNARLTLDNTAFINNGNFIAGSSVISFAGNASSTISGTQLVQFHELEMNKTNNSSVILQQAIGVRERIHFAAGFLDLNGFNADLGTTGRLENEDETTHVTGTKGGEVVISTGLNAPINANPGNLGAVISSSQNLGNVVIRRGHQSQSGTGLINSIFRYYEIVPGNNSNLDASLQISYFNGELNGLDENAFVFFKTDDGTTWSNEGFTSGNTNGNFIVKTGINSFSRWTLSNGNSPLPVHFVLFNAKCGNNKVTMIWKTAQEQNSDRFNVERSIDGIQWTVIGSVLAAGNRNIEQAYSFTDSNPLPISFYRIAEFDLDGRKQFTSILRSSCAATDIISSWPNPTHDKVFINLNSTTESGALVRIFDSKGSLVKMQRATVLPGSNQLSIDMGSLTNGFYHLSVDWNNGQMKKTISVLKR